MISKFQKYHSWYGTGIGLCLTLKTEHSLRWMWAGQPDIAENFPQLLKIVVATTP